MAINNVAIDYSTINNRAHDCHSLSYHNYISVKNLIPIRTTDRMNFSKKHKNFGYVDSSEIQNEPAVRFPR